MTTHQPRSRRPHHHDDVHGIADSGRCDHESSLGEIDLAFCRLELTGDGWYLDAVDSETIADPPAAVRRSGPRGRPLQEQLGRVVVIGVVLPGDLGESIHALQAAADVIRSAVRSLLDSDDIRVELTVVGPEAGRDG